MVTVGLYSKAGADEAFAPKDLGDPVTQAALEEMFGSPLVFLGGWDASTNIPELSDGTGVSGNYYEVNVPATADLGSGDIAFQLGDTVIYLDGVWTRYSFASDPRVTVSNETGLRIARGTIDSSGAGSIVRGEGFSFVKNNTGNVTVVFDVPFSQVPTIVLTCYDAGGALGPIASHFAGSPRTTDAFEVAIYTIATAYTDAVFDFIAIGEA
jgi:hypothetical protein